MKHYAILVALCCLNGCIHYQPNDPLQKVVTGKVTMPVRLYKTAEVNIRFYAQTNGRLLLINHLQYRLDLLPLAFTFTASEIYQAQQKIYLQATLAWSDSQFIQATYQQVIENKKSSLSICSRNPVFQIANIRISQPQM